MLKYCRQDCVFICFIFPLQAPSGPLVSVQETWSIVMGIDQVASYVISYILYGQLWSITKSESFREQYANHTVLV